MVVYIYIYIYIYIYQYIRGLGFGFGCGFGFRFAVLGLRAVSVLGCRGWGLWVALRVFLPPLLPECGMRRSVSGSE